MGLYKYLQEMWKKPKTSPEWKSRLIAWRKEPATVRIEHPTRLDRARSLGYKAVQGMFVVRQRVKRGGRQRPLIKKGRRPKTRRRKKIVAKNYRQVAEERANKKFANCEVLNSYWVADDGNYKWYEVILVDPEHPQIKARGIQLGRGRTYRGKTSAGRKNRGLRKKGKGAEKIRPSQKANQRKAH